MIRRLHLPTIKPGHQVMPGLAFTSRVLHGRSSACEDQRTVTPLAKWRSNPNPRIAHSLLRFTNCAERREPTSMNSTKTASQRPNPEGVSGNLVSISPFFIVKDLQASISHYIERLGFQLDFQGPADDLYYGQSEPGRDRHHAQGHPSRRASSVQTTPGTNGRVGMRTSTPWTPTRSSTSSRQRGASFVKELSFIDEGLWGFEVTDADGYVLAFFRVRNE